MRLKIDTLADCICLLAGYVNLIDGPAAVTGLQIRVPVNCLPSDFYRSTCQKLNLSDEEWGTLFRNSVF